MQHPGHRCDRYQYKQDEATEVGGDEHGPSGQTIDPDTNKKAEYREWQELKCRQYAYLRRRGVKDEYGKRWKRKECDLASKAAYGLASPELSEVFQSNGHRKTAHKGSAALMDVGSVMRELWFIGFK